MELVQIYFQNLNKSAINTKFLAFFSFYLNISPPESGSRRENECGSGSTDFLSGTTEKAEGKKKDHGAVEEG